MVEPARLGVRLAEVYRLLGPLYRQVQRRVEDDEPVMGMSVGVRAVLDELARVRSATVPTLAAGLGLSRQFVQRMINAAIGSGWVRRCANPAHRRSVLMTLTDDGRAAIEAVLAREHELMGRTPGALTDGDIDATLRVLAAMRAALDALEPPAGGPGGRAEPG